MNAFAALGVGDTRDDVARVAPEQRSGGSSDTRGECGRSRHESRATVFGDVFA